MHDRFFGLGEALYTALGIDKKAIVVVVLSTLCDIW